MKRWRLINYCRNWIHQALFLQATFGLRGKICSDNWWTLSSNCSSESSLVPAISTRPSKQTSAEQQLELIAPIAHSTKEAHGLLGAISDVAGRSIDQSECLWPLSTIRWLKRYYHRPSGKQIRTPLPEGLAKKIWQKLRAISGIHYNMELGKDLVAALFQVSSYHLLKDFKMTSISNWLETFCVSDGS